MIQINPLGNQCFTIDLNPIIASINSKTFKDKENTCFIFLFRAATSAAHEKTMSNPGEIA